MTIMEANLKAIETNFELNMWAHEEFNINNVAKAKRIDKVLRRRYLTLGKFPLIKRK